MKSVAALLVSVVVVGLAAAFGGQFMPGEWYAALAKPSWTPPNGLFGPVWTLLYLAMAVSAWLVWLRRDQAYAGAGLAAFGAQLVLNALWSWFFFGIHFMGVAFADIVALLLLIGVTIVLFWRVSKPAALLLAPYFCWVAFASALNFAVWRLNV